MILMTLGVIALVDDVIHLAVENVSTIVLGLILLVAVFVPAYVLEVRRERAKGGLEVETKKTAPIVEGGSWWSKHSWLIAAVGLIAIGAGVAAWSAVSRMS